MAYPEIPNPAPELSDSYLREGRIDALPEHIAEGIDAREGVLRFFAENPVNQEVWEYVAEQALEEERYGHEQPLELTRISASELIMFAERVLEVASEYRYGLTAYEAPNDELWFDVLYGFHSPEGDRVIKEQMQQQINACDIKKVERAIDLGTGTGETASIIAPFAEHTTGVDRESSLLGIARERNPDISFTQADVARLPFKNGSADVITSDSLKYALDSETAISMYEEISRVLKPGGIYIDAEWKDPENIVLRADSTVAEHPDIHPEGLKAMVTWRAVLQDMIVDTISGKFENTDMLPQEGPVWDDLKTELGLYEYRSTSNNNQYVSVARVLRKG